ncbi:GntR family transcriptional regulator [Cryptosporangium aurantiacum]|uniref:Transcriptional regulator, TetR family n=1 Tax=Cryptosporangium aurantiacum TaxID=134849 RepID=A0A1M7RHY3_9ACTN|nr:GntR family transcriptional regulator [Cryptosporangium aurantiacum]SHN45857.1 transcriptional regulator, TetR family [Cryptosporangium aurantiacum]
MSDTPSARIVAELRRRIETGELAPGDRLPSTRQITRQWNVAMATATKVLTALRQQGLVEAVPGIGTVVRGTEPPAEHKPEKTPNDAPAPIGNPVLGLPDPPRRRRRGAETPLTRDRIVAAALHIADTHGMAELSMRRVAADLDVATMALYRYVPSKEDLVLLMMDMVFRDFILLPPVEPDGWRAKLEAVARIQWEGYQQHSWMGGALSFSRPQMIPRGMVHTEYAMAALRDTGLAPTEMLHSAVTMFNHVRSMAMVFDEERRNIQDTGISAGEWMEMQDHAMLEILATGEFPMMATVSAIPGDALTIDSIFEFGLARYLDGLEALIADRAARN